MTINSLTILLCFLFVGLSTQNGPPPQGNYPPGYGAQGYPQHQQYQQPPVQYAPSDGDLQQQQLRYQQYQQYQQRMQQQQQQQGQARDPQYNRGPYQSRFVAPQDYDAYIRGSPFPSQPEGIFSKLKQSIVSAGSSIANVLTSSVGTDSPPESMFSPQQAGRRALPETDEYGRPFPPRYSAVQPHPHADGQHMQQQQQQQSGILRSVVGRMKGWFSGPSDETHSVPVQPPQFQYQQQQQYGRHQVPPQPTAASSPSYGSAGYASPRYVPPSGPLDASVDSSAMGGATLAAGQGPVDFYPSQGAARVPTEGWPLPPQQQQQQQSAPPVAAAPSAPAVSSAAAAAAPVDPLSLISSEPQVVIHEDNVVMILNPLEFYRKKFALLRAGPSALQVFSDFERVLTKAKNGENKNAEATLSSMDVIETAALNADSLNKLKVIAESDYPEMDAAAFEDMTVKSQAVLVESNAVNYGSIAPAVRANLARMGLRPGWLSSLTSLCARGVPTFVFSSGYGDIVREALLQGGLTQGAPQGQYSSGGGAAAAAGAASTSLPQNVRVISNYFRFDPTGNVKAFSQPVVHERNKNATTAAAHMGMPVPSRPHALVIGSHEDDVKMTEGISGLKEQLSIGYMEVGADLTDRLPAYLKAFDVVIVGDSSLAYVNALVDELMHLPKKSSTGSGSSSGGEASGGVGALLNFRRLGGFLGSVTSAQPAGASSTASNSVGPSAASSGAARTNTDYFLGGQ